MSRIDNVEGVSGSGGDAVVHGSEQPGVFRAEA